MEWNVKINDYDGWTEGEVIKTKRAKKSWEAYIK